MQISTGHSSHPFVGRQHELAALEDALSETTAGKGHIVMLVGEPGIGKTRTVSEFAALSTQHEAQICWGRCFEEPGAPPYWPWLQALRELVASTAPDRLGQVLDHATAVVLELLPELIEHAPTLSPPPSVSDAAQARYRLFDAVNRLLQRLAQQQPIVLIFDNLHWADTPSLRLLDFVTRGLSRTRMMVVGTFRDQELTRQHPLSNSLSEFARLPTFVRLALSGLAAEHTEQFLRNAVGDRISAEVMEAIHARTEGHPLYMVEMARYLAQLEKSKNEGSRSLLLHRVPAGIREVIGSRLNRLSDRCNEMLMHASVIGRRFQLSVIRATLPLFPDELMAVQEEALSARVIEELNEPGWYQFSHALLREAIYDEISGPRKRRLHHQMALALEELYSSDPTPVLSTLVHHYRSAAPEADPRRVVPLMLRAAGHAHALLAHEETVRYYRLALEIMQSQPGAEPLSRCQLLLKLGHAQAQASEHLEAMSTLRQAFELAKETGARREMAEAAIEFEDAGQKLSMPGELLIGPLREVLALLDERQAALKARALSGLGRALSAMGRFADSNEAAAQAVRMARASEDPLTLAQTLTSTFEGLFLQGDQFELRRANTEEAHALACQGGHKELLIDILAWRMAHLTESGDIVARDKTSRQFAQLAGEMRNGLWIYMGTASQAAIDLAQGRFLDSERLALRARQLGQGLPSWDVDSGFSVQMFNLYREQGRLQQLAPILTNFLGTVDRNKQWLPELMVLHMELDHKEEAAKLFEELAAQDFADLPNDGTWGTSTVYLAEVCTYLDSKRHAPLLYRLLLPYCGRNIITGFQLSVFGPIDRFLGMLASVMERWEEAERHFRAARAMSERQGSVPATAHIHHDFARMLLKRNQGDDATEAQDLLDSSIALAAQLGMHSLDARARALHESLAPRQRSPYPASLSQREVEVLRWIAQGKSNQEIADQLCRSINTVANHVRNILGKIGAANRAEAAIFAARHGLLDE